MEPKPLHRNRLRSAIFVLAILFAFTGCAGLLAEQSFEKMLTSLVGASTPAAAIVLSVYFLGLTLGSWLYARYRRSTWNPLRTYALLEGGVAVWAILLALSHKGLVVLLTPLLRLGVDQFWLLQSLRFLVACLWILPPTMLMGATFPAVVDALALLRVPQPRRALSRFYALNLLGAIVGALIGPYWIFSSIGLVGALLFTGLIDGIASGLAFRLSQIFHLRTIGDSSETPLSITAIARRHKILIAIAFFSGFLFFSLEVVWTHLMGVSIGASIYAFAAMLALVLMGLGLGGALSTMLFPERKPISAWVIGVMFLIGSLLLIWQFGSWPEVPMLYMVWGGGLTTFSQGELLRWIQAGRLLLPPTIVFGMVYPALFRMDSFPSEDRARIAAMMSAGNSIGCVLGALAAGFIMIPKLGSEASLKFAGLLALLSGALIAWFYTQGAKRWILMVGSVVLLGTWTGLDSWNRLALTNGGNVYFRPYQVNPGSELLFFHEDTLGGITTVIQNGYQLEGKPAKAKILLTNGKFQANDSGEVHAQTGLAIIPILHAPKLERALVIGLGSGHSAAIVRELGFQRIDIAEISPGIVLAAKTHFAHINDQILDQPNVRLFLEDGRNQLLLNNTQYDLITMEISSIWFAGSTSLYSREFYELAKKRLRTGGIMQQWIQVHHLGTEEVGSVLATMRQVFPYVSFWFVGGQGILVASNEPLALRSERLESLLVQNPWRDQNQSEIKTKVGNLLSTRVLAPDDTDRMLQRVEFPINTDGNRYLEYASPKYNLSPLNHAPINILQFSRFATFGSQEALPSWPSTYSGVSQGLTPNSYRQTLGLKNENNPNGAP
jgi:spermidine synthase